MYPDGAATDANGRGTVSNIFTTDFTSGPKTKGLVAWWKMDEGTGTTTSGGLSQILHGRPPAYLI